MARPNNPAGGRQPSPDLDPMLAEQLRALYEAETNARDNLRRSVHLARRLGYTWAAIARALGTTPENVSQRFRLPGSDRLPPLTNPTDTH